MSINVGYGFRRARTSSGTVIRFVHVPAWRVSAAIRLRWLNSRIAITMASRLVDAFANRIASLSSSSGISTVVFMIPLSTMVESIARDCGIPANRERGPRNPRAAGRGRAALGGGGDSQSYADALRQTQRDGR